MTKESKYVVFSGPEIRFEPRTIANARKVVRRLVAQGHHVICDHEVSTRDKFSTTRLFRNDPQFPLNVLKA